MNRFAGNWNDVMPGQSKGSFLMLFDAMTDLKYQCKRLTKEIARGDTVE
jgi:hypothetical protein